MLQHHTIRVIAAFAALAHAYFAYGETRKWGPALVANVAPKWLLDKAGRRLPEERLQIVVAWASKLAFNVGIYNLMLAVGLAWVAVGGAECASLGIFFALWLLVAAAAAWSTDVVLAFYVQGGFGILLLAAAAWAGHATGSW